MARNGSGGSAGGSGSSAGKSAASGRQTGGMHNGRAVGSTIRSRTRATNTTGGSKRILDEVEDLTGKKKRSSGNTKVNEKPASPAAKAKLVAERRPGMSKTNAQGAGPGVESTGTRSNDSRPRADSRVSAKRTVDTAQSSGAALTANRRSSSSSSRRPATRRGSTTKS